MELSDVMWVATLLVVVALAFSLGFLVGSQWARRRYEVGELVETPLNAPVDSEPRRADDAEALGRGASGESSTPPVPPASVPLPTPKTSTPTEPPRDSSPRPAPPRVKTATPEPGPVRVSDDGQYVSGPRATERVGPTQTARRPATSTGVSREQPGRPSQRAESPTVAAQPKPTPRPAPKPTRNAEAATQGRAEAASPSKPQAARPQPEPRVAKATKADRTAPDATIVTRTGPKSAGAPLKDPYAEADRDWTAAEDVRARELVREGATVRSMALRLKIPKDQVVRRLARTVYGYTGMNVLKILGDGSRYHKRYGQEDLDLMRSLIESGAPIEDVAARLNRSVDGVVWRAIDRQMLPPGF